MDETTLFVIIAGLAWYLFSQSASVAASTATPSSSSSSTNTTAPTMYGQLNDVAPSAEVVAACGADFTAQIQPLQQQLNQLTASTPGISYTSPQVQAILAQANAICPAAVDQLVAQSQATGALLS